jgi:putative acetyltransferase
VVTLRPYRPDDAPALLALFRDTIRRVNCRDYSPAQVAAWASDDIDTATWFGRFAGRFVPVAEVGGRPVGFAELEANGHIDRVYVSADHQRCGIGRQLLAAVVARPGASGSPGCSPRPASLPGRSSRVKDSWCWPRRW